eukprot:Anaeramoba_ignava/c19603_g1_i1.p3 GENE.c19603_g1_i1~~c19603_g1_i1.p3  ORF type:complete len:111 (+),score=33.82 c19603_g1_i1:1334-1666(+)
MKDRRFFASQLPPRDLFSENSNSFLNRKNEFLDCLNQISQKELRNIISSVDSPHFPSRLFQDLKDELAAFVDNFIILILAYVAHQNTFAVSYSHVILGLRSLMKDSKLIL